MGGMRGLKDDETLYEHMFFGAVFVNSWDHVGILFCHCVWLVVLGWVFLDPVDVLMVVIGVDGLTCDLGRPEMQIFGNLIRELMNIDVTLPCTYDHNGIRIVLHY